MLLLFKSLMSQKHLALSLSFEIDTFSNYPFDDFRNLQDCKDANEYSFYCYALCKSGFTREFYYLRVMDITMVDGVHFLFYCPAYKDSDNMANKRIITEPNKLNLTPGKLSIELDDVPKPKLDYSNSVYDARLKRRVPILDFKSKEESKDKLKPAKEKKEKVSEAKENEMVYNTDTRIEGELHSSDFLPPFICTRLWVLSRGRDTGWGWYLRNADGQKFRTEYYCRPIELTHGYQQYERGGSMFTKAFLKSEFPILDNEFLEQIDFVNSKKELGDKYREAMQVVIDALLYKEKNNLDYCFEN